MRWNDGNSTKLCVWRFNPLLFYFGTESQCDLYSFIDSNTKMRHKKRKLCSVENAMNDCCFLCDKQKNWLDKMVGTILNWVVKHLQSLAYRDTKYLIVLWHLILADSIWTDSKKKVSLFFAKRYASFICLNIQIVAIAVGNHTQRLLSTLSFSGIMLNPQFFSRIWICYGTKKNNSIPKYITRFEK